MRCPTLIELPPPPPGKTGWPWTEESEQLPDTMPDPSIGLRTSGSPWPRVSLVTPSYNQGQFIEEAIRSVLLQGYPDLEYIIIDGGSTDGSVEIIRKYEPWLAYWVSEPDRGQSHAINKGLERSTGQLFNWHNSDDVLTPNSLAITAAAMVNFPTASYAHGYRIVIDGQGNVLRDTKHSFDSETGFVPERTQSVSNLTGGQQPGCLMDRDLVVEVGGVDENLHYVMDRDLTLRLELVKPPLYVNHPVIYLRIHSEAKSLLWDTQRAKERLIIARKIFRRRDLPPSVEALKKTSFATAHRFAWECYAAAGIEHLALWHLLLDIFYSPRGGWQARRAVLDRSISRNQVKRLVVLPSMVQGLGQLFSLLRKSQKFGSRMPGR
jgi:GT2 family glycosyltransferase